MTSGPRPSLAFVPDRPALGGREDLGSHDGRQVHGDDPLALGGRQRRVLRKVLSHRLVGVDFQDTGLLDVGDAAELVRLVPLPLAGDHGVLPVVLQGLAAVGELARQEVDEAAVAFYQPFPDAILLRLVVAGPVLPMEGSKLLPRDLQPATQSGT